MNFSHPWLARSLIVIWSANCILASFIAIRQVWIPFMDAENSNYSQIISDPFDGTVMPIAYIPDWTKTANQDKSKRFEDISISEYLPVPLYDPLDLGSDLTNTKKSSIILHYTYITPYMGNYKLDYKEHAGSHLGVDIRAPLGTPVLSIANGVVVRTVEADSTGNRFVVIRHDGVPRENWQKWTLYSAYLHLSEITVPEWTRIHKWDMLGRVGMSGIATTPHLHLQIDTADAPFHPYWPFTSSDAKDAWVDFFSAINIGLWKEKAEKYTINPMSFINTYLWGLWLNNTNGWWNIVKDVLAQTETPVTQSTIATSYRDQDSCNKKRYSDVNEKVSFGKMLYPLMDSKCLFREQSSVFDPKWSLTYREALINLMKFYNISPVNGTSHFLDINIGDSLQWYALVAYRKWYLDGNYAHPDRILSREEFIELLVKIGKLEKNPSQIKIYKDVDAMNPNFQSIQDYAFRTRVRWGKFYPKTLMTRGMMVQMLSNLSEKK